MPVQLLADQPVEQAAVAYSPSLLHEFFEFQAASRPECIALEFEASQWTYAEVDQWANQLARLLREHRVRTGKLVAVWLPRSVEMNIAILAVLKAGAAYVPLDPECPPDRVEFILADCQAHTLITTAEMARSIPSAAAEVEILPLDQSEDELRRQSSESLGSDEVGVRPEDLAYVIYTSGSTGRPKGVMIEHRSICNLVRGEQEIYGVLPNDRVFQGFSIAFDASLEEIWMAFASGATLVVGSQEMVHSGADLARQLTEARITVLSCVPTLLAMMEDDIPTLRILILGGEACPQHLATRWCRAGLRMFNTYGPTEATVIATYQEVYVHTPITIGRPAPHYVALVLDENLQAVPPGIAGELHLGGVGLARGYLGREKLTQERFIANPFERSNKPSRLYKTGDLCRFNSAGELQFLGRIDSQVKIRGFRVELAEIESLLLEQPGIRAAAVTLREDQPGLQQLVAYYVPSGDELCEEALRTALRARLPLYMLPAIFEPLAALPVLPSGKVDRKSLPVPLPRGRGPKPAAPPVSTAVQKRLLTAWQEIFAPLEVGLSDNFFLDLGGHSLLAARMISLLRQEPTYARLSMLDIYQHPTIAELASQFESEETVSQTSTAPIVRLPRSQPSSSVAFLLCGLTQAISLYFVLGFFSLQWLAPYLTYTWLREDGVDIDDSLLGGILALIAVYPVMLALSIGIKWLVLGRVKQGRYPLWGSYYFRWWLVQSVVRALPISYLSGTPLLAWYFRLMGARIGANVHLDSDNLTAFDLVQIGDDASISTDSVLDGCTVQGGMLHLGPIQIGNGCFVGTRSVIREHTVMKEGSRLEDLSLLPANSVIPCGETWAGSPAEPLEAQPAPLASVDRSSLLRRFLFGLAHLAGVLLFPVVAVSAIFPGVVLMNHLNAHDDWYYYLVYSPLVAVSFIVLLCLEIALVKWLLLGRVKAGEYPLYSSFYWRKWFVDQLLEMSIDIIGPLYSTLYLAPWYRLLGAKIGKRAEISTASFISPDLLTLGEESFIADIASLGAHRVENGVMSIAEISVGKRSFIGNSALLPPGSVIGDNCLIGCLSLPPRHGVASADGTSWVGSPALFLPQRQEHTSFSSEQTFSPPARLYVVRGAIEFLRVILPSTAFIVLTSLLFSYVAIYREEMSLAHLLLVFPGLYALCAVTAALFVVVMKWLVMGRYRQGEAPLWSDFVWRSEMITGLHDYLATPFLIEVLRGTPFAAWYFRLLGAKIGRRVYLDTTQLTEFDLVEIGDEAALNSDATLQTHLFEDRVMKMSRVDIGPKCCVGAGSLVLYDTRMDAGSVLGDLSLLMKGEVLPAGSHWQGIPAVSQDGTCKKAEVQALLVVETK